MARYQRRGIEMTVNSFEHLREWCGKKEIRSDSIAAWPIVALAATLDEANLKADVGSPVPNGWHWIFFLDAKPASELGPDGHPKRGGFLPPVQLPRRMWAGGRLEFIQPLKIGDSITRESEILSVEPKTGRSGTLVFLTVRHTVKRSGAAAIVEDQDIVYREAAKEGEPLPAGKQASGNATAARSIMANSTLLFRYSALTFNRHRIHS